MLGFGPRWGAPLDWRRRARAEKLDGHRILCRLVRIKPGRAAIRVSSSASEGAYGARKRGCAYARPLFSLGMSLAMPAGAQREARHRTFRMPKQNGVAGESARSARNAQVFLFLGMFAQFLLFSGRRPWHRAARVRAEVLRRSSSICGRTRAQPPRQLSPGQRFPTRRRSPRVH
jgi:hypothetical protein